MHRARRDVPWGAVPACLQGEKSGGDEQAALVGRGRRQDQTATAAIAKDRAVAAISGARALEGTLDVEAQRGIGLLDGETVAQGFQTSRKDARGRVGQERQQRQERAHFQKSSITQFLLTPYL